MVQDMRVNGVEIIAVCGEPQEHVDEMMKKHNLTFTVSHFGINIISMQ